MPSQTTSRFFSTTPSLSRRTRDLNRNRGVSPMRKTRAQGSKQQRSHPMSVDRFPLPQPVLDRPNLKPETDADHGLWQFFNKKRSRISWATDEANMGRAWTIAELRGKSWEECHRLWWVCFKERNRVRSSLMERQRLGATHGQKDLENRDRMIVATMKHIKWVLTERWYAWEDARKLAVTDQSVNLSGEGVAYMPELEPTEDLYEPERADGQPQARI